MKFRIWLTSMVVFVSCLPAWGVEVRPLAECAVKVFNDINKNRVWTGKLQPGCRGKVYVEERRDGLFVTIWNSTGSEQGWDRLSFSAAVGYSELANKKALATAGRDIRTRAARIERCLNSILRTNDPLECRDYGVKSYLAGDRVGTEYQRQVWLDDNGRHSVVEYAYGDSHESVAAPADLFRGTELPPGTKLNIHVFDNP